MPSAKNITSLEEIKGKLETAQAVFMVDYTGLTHIQLEEFRHDLATDKEVAYAVSSSKSMMGHTMGASGAIEAAIAALALRDQILPPTINMLHVMEEGIGVDLVPNQARSARISRSGSKNFGFGGSGTHVLFKHYQPR